MPCLSDGIKHTHSECEEGFNTLLCKICCNNGEVPLMPCANIFLFTVPPSSALSSFLFVLHSLHFNDGLLRQTPFNTLLNFHSRGFDLIKLNKNHVCVKLSQYYLGKTRVNASIKIPKPLRRRIQIANNANRTCQRCCQDFPNCFPLLRCYFLLFSNEISFFICRAK